MSVTACIKSKKKVSSRASARILRGMMKWEKQQVTKNKIDLYAEEVPYVLCV